MTEFIACCGGDPEYIHSIDCPRHTITTEGLCPVYKEPILPDEDDRCSLCGAPNQHEVPA